MPLDQVNTPELLAAVRYIRRQLNPKPEELPGATLLRFGWTMEEMERNATEAAASFATAR